MEAIERPNRDPDGREAGEEEDHAEPHVGDQLELVSLIGLREAVACGKPGRRAERQTVAVEGDTVRFKVILTTPACPLKDRIKSFGFRTWSDTGDPKNGPDFLVEGEAKIKRLSMKLPASGLVVTKYALNGWTIKVTDRATGEEIYFNTTLPKGIGSWAGEGDAMKAISKWLPYADFPPPGASPNAVTVSPTFRSRTCPTSASSQPMRLNSPLPLGPVRLSGCSRRSGA